MVQSQLVPPSSYNNTQESGGKNLASVLLVVVILCLLPLERWMFPFNLKIVDIALVLLIICGLMRLSSRLPIHLPLVVPVSLIIIASLIAMIASSAGSTSVLAVIQEAYIYMWFVFLTSLLASFAVSDLERFMKIWCIIALMEATVTFMGMIDIGPDIFYTSPEDGGVLSSQGLNRAIGTYVNPNAAAAYLSISFFILLAIRWPSWLRSVFGVWLFVGIVATGSMSALVSTIFSFFTLILVYLILERQRTVAFSGTVFCFATALVAFGLLITTILPSFLSVADTIVESHIFSLNLGRITRSLTSRFALINTAWSDYIQNPLGTGPNSFESLGSLHNDYVAFLFERGPLGAIGLLLLVGATLSLPLRVAFLQKDNKRSWQVLSFGAGFLACAVIAVSHEVSHFRQVWVLMAFLYAISYSLLSQPCEKSIVI